MELVIIVIYLIGFLISYYIIKKYVRNENDNKVIDIFMSIWLSIFFLDFCCFYINTFYNGEKINI